MSVVSNNQAVNGAQFLGAWVNEVGLSGPNAALLFLNALETQRSSRRVQTTIQKLRASAKYKEFLNQKMQKNRELQNYIKNNSSGGSDGETYVTMQKLLEDRYKLEKPPTKPTEPNEADYKDSSDFKEAMDTYNTAMEGYDVKYKGYAAKYDKAKQQAVRDFGLDKPTYNCDMKTSAITTTSSPENMMGKNTNDRAKHSISLNDLTVEETRLKGEADATDSARELELVMVQSALSRQQQLTGLMSSMIKKTNEAANGVIRNI